MPNPARVMARLASENGTAANSLPKTNVRRGTGLMSKGSSERRSRSPGVISAQGTPAELLQKTGQTNLEDAFIAAIGSEEGLE